MKTNSDKRRLFSFKKMEWPRNDNWFEIEIRRGKVGELTLITTERLRIIDGTEHPELFLLWLQQYRERILNEDRLTPAYKKQVLFSTTEGTAKSIVDRAIEVCEGKRDANHEWIPSTFDFQNHLIKRKVSKLTTATALKNYVESGEHTLDTITEAIHALKFKFFGYGMNGRNSYVRLKHQMRTLRLDLTNGIRKWAARMNDFQSYLPNMLWEAGEERGEKMTAFTETEMRELLDICLSDRHHSLLCFRDWDVYEKTYYESIAYVKIIEAQIRDELEREKQLREIETWIASTKRKRQEKDSSSRNFLQKERRKGGNDDDSRSKSGSSADMLSEQYSELMNVHRQ